MIVRYRDGRVPRGQRAHVGARVGGRAAGRARPVRSARGDLGPGAGSQPLRRGAAALGAGQARRRRAGARARRCALHAGRHGAVAGRAARTPTSPPRRRRSWMRSAIPAASPGSAPRWAVSRPAPRCASPSRCSRASSVIDTHAHLESVRRRAGRGGRRGAAGPASSILTIGREQAVDLAARHAGVWAVVGWHPHEAAEAPTSAAAPAASRGRGWWRWARSASTSIVTTLPATRSVEPSPSRSSSPTSCRCRSSSTPATPTTRRSRCSSGPVSPVVLHCFSSPQRLARGGGARLPDVVRRQRHLSQGRRPAARRPRSVPAHLLLAETDSPYLAPVPLRGRPNRRPT